jgi:hypothetical protein
MAVRGAVGPGGWGYNRTTEPDADSTAWSLRFLSLLGRPHAGAAAACLGRYLDPSGSAHTFVGNAGTWGFAHPDVTPLVGLALTSVSAPDELLRRVRGAVLAGREGAGIWSSFWWSTETYATAWSVQFLAASGGVPRAVAGDAERWLRSLPAPSNGFESAHRLLLATTLDLADTQLGARLVDELLALRERSRAWEPSSVLLVPERAADASAPSLGPYCDQRALMTTAAACAALVGWLRATSSTRHSDAARRV